MMFTFPSEAFLSGKLLTFFVCIRHEILVKNKLFLICVSIFEKKIVSLQFQLERRFS